MRLPLVSIGRSMIAIAIIATALSLFRVCGDLFSRVHSSWHEYIVGIVPMASVLIFGLVVFTTDIARRRRPSSFWVGFEAFGWAALFAYVSFLVGNFRNEDRLFSSRLRPLMESILNIKTYSYHDTNVLVFFVAITALPQLIIAMLGGWLTHAWGIVLVRERGSGFKDSSPFGNTDEL